MDEILPEPPLRTGHRTVQHYIDERPVWSDGTALPTVPMTSMQWRIWSQAQIQRIGAVLQRSAAVTGGQADHAR